MRYFVGRVFLLLALLASSLGASAQDGEKATTAEPNAKEPALKLGVDAAGAEVTPSPPQTPDEYTLMRRRVKRARSGLISMAALTAAGGVVIGAGLAAASRRPPGGLIHSGEVAAAMGGFVAAAGAVGMIVTGTLLGVRKGRLRSREQAHYRTPRRVQWDLARSRLVF